MAALHSRCGHYIFALRFLLLSSFFFFAYSQPSKIGCLPYFHTWCGLSVNLRCRSEMYYTRLAENTERTKSRKIRHLGTIAQFCRAISSQVRHVSSIGKIVKQQHLLHMFSQYMVNFGPLPAEIGLPVWGTPANFNGFRVLPSLRQRRRSREANQTLHDVWPCLGLVHYIHSVPKNSHFVFSS